MNKRQQQSCRIEQHTIWITVGAGIITLWGLLAIYHTQALTGSWQIWLMRQSLWALTAWGIFAAVGRIKFDMLMKYILPATGAGALLLLLLPLLGSNVNGMSGWIKVGSISLQPSELLKPLYILALVKVLHMPEWSELKRSIAALGIIAVFTVLMLLQPDFGTMSIYLLGGLATLYFCGVKFRYLLLSAAAAIPAAAAAIILNAYMRKRLIHFFRPELDPLGGSWHLHQLTLAVSRGEWSGVKGDMAVWSNSFLPLVYNDSIFAGLCEMLGFFGAFTLLMLYTGLFWQAFALGSWRSSKIRRGVIESMTCMLMLQTILHISVNLGLLPPTGVTLPLISYGGSSLLSTMLMLAIIIRAGKLERPHLPGD